MQEKSKRIKIYCSKKLLTFFSLLIITPFIIASSSCEKMISQRAADLFQDGRLPKDLVRIQSQVLGFSLKEKEAIIERVKADQKRTDLIKVAVIDSGVDLTHRDLQRFLDYQVVDGKITGVGHDFMTDRPFGSNVFFDATLFAFGSRGIQNGRIVEKNEASLRMISELNQRFREYIIAGIQNDPNLSKSLFRHLKAEGFTIFGFNEIVQRSGSYLRNYNEVKEKNQIINESNLSEQKNPRFIDSVDPKNGTWSEMKLVNDSSYDSHRPSALSNFTSLEHADLFIKLVQETFEKMETEFQYNKNVELVKQLIAAQKGLDINDESVEKTAIEKLKSATEFILFGSDVYNPIYQIEKTFRKYSKFKNLSFKDAIKVFISDIKSYREQIEQGKDLPKDTIKYLKNYEGNLVKLENILNELAVVSQDPIQLGELKSKLRRETYRTRHPYISKETNDNVHATHVSATIAKQLPDQIRIIPIRVTTQSISLPEEVKNKLAHEMVNEFIGWTKNPFYEELKREILSEYEEYGLKKMTDEVILKTLKKQLVESSLNTVFIKQLFQSITKVGELGAHLANVSLGMAYEKSFQKDNSEKSFVEDLFSEFVRYHTGELLRDKAPNTLFFVATGNEKAWIDGITRVAFPVGIRSPRMDLLTRRMNIPNAPNNLVENLIPVISVNSKGYLTSFANQLINMTKNVLGSTGEEILASTPRSSKNATEKLVTKLLSPSLLWLSSVNLAMSDINLKKVYSGEIGFEELESQSQRVASDIPLKLKETYRDLLHLKSPIDRQELSGTSMATPSATGRSAAIIAEVLKKNGQNTEALFKDLRLSMPKITEAIFEKAVEPPYQLVTKIGILTDGLKKWSQPKEVKEVKSTLNRILNSKTKALSVCSKIFN